ncbi:hypothetical protein Tco_0775477, partial [Tanacetum coccineum]
SWAEDEAKRAREQAKVLEEARDRWESQGIKVVVNKDLCDDAVAESTWVDNQNQSLIEGDEGHEDSSGQVILIGSISVEIPVAPEVGAATVASPARVLELNTYSSSKPDPSESSLSPVYVAPMIKVSLRSSSPTTYTLEIPTTPIPLAPSTVVAPSTDIISPIDAIHHSISSTDSYILIPTRQSVRPLPSHRLALRYTSHHLDRFTFGSSSGYSSSDHSLSGHSILGHSLSGHTPPVTTVADLSAPSRFVYPPLARTLRWDSSSESSAGPYRKRCRSPAGFYFTKNSVEEVINTDVLRISRLDATTIRLQHAYGVRGPFMTGTDRVGHAESLIARGERLVYLDQDDSFSRRLETFDLRGRLWDTQTQDDITMQLD